MAKDWDTDIKREVRRTEMLLSGKGYAKMVDLPGSQILSTIAARDHGVVAPDGQYVLVEKDPREVPAIHQALDTHGFTNDQYVLLNEASIEDLRTTPHLSDVGFLNLDLMTTLTPRLLHLISRTKFIDGGTLAVTAYHSNTRQDSDFLRDAYCQFGRIYGNLRTEFSAFRGRYHYLTYDGQDGPVIHLRDGEDIEKNIRYSFFLYWLLLYGLRHHTFTHRCSILYSGSRGSMASRMITFIFNDIQRQEETPDDVVFWDRHGHSGILEELSRFLDNRDSGV